MRSIALLHHAASKYGVLDQMTQDLCSAFKRAGISSVILTLDEKNPDALLPKIREIAPDCK